LTRLDSESSKPPLAYVAASPPRASIVRRLGFLPLLAPSWLVLGGLFIVPLFGILLLSLAKADEFGSFQLINSLAELWEHVRSGAAWENYVRAFGRRPREYLWRSTWMAVATTVLCALVSYPTAYYIAVRATGRLKATLLLLAVVPFWTSFLIRTYAWIVILRPRGLANTALQWLGVTDAPLPLLYNDFAVMVGLVYGELPFMILPLYASLEKLDRSLLEASADLGAGSWATFRRVTFPLSLPGLVAGAVLVFVPSLGQFVVSDLLGGDKSQLVGNVIQARFVPRSGVGDKPFGAALTVQLVAMVLLMVGAYARWARRRGEDVL
jgi:spermidine/putrescine transport system permease protein